MSCLRIRIATSLLVMGGFLANPVAGAAERQPEAVALARSVPADARLFFEVTDVHALLKARAGHEFAELLAGLIPTATMHPATQPTTQPATTWQQVLGEKLGLRDARAAQLLFGARVALAADSWSTNDLDELVLLTEPPDPVALEKELEAGRLPTTTPADAKVDVVVRRYRLGAGHELASDGHTVVVGRPKRRGGLYARTVVLWETGRRATLADLVDFRERTSGLPAEASIVFYSGPAVHGLSAVSSGLSILWPDLKSVAVGVVMNGRAVTVETCASLRVEGGTQGAEPPVDALLRVPVSTVAAWTRPIRYVDEFKQMDAANPGGPIRFYLTVLQHGLPAGTLENRLLSHLVGDSVILIGQQPVAPVAGSESEKLLVPTVALAVETDDPDAVASVLKQMSENLVGLLNLGPPGGKPVALQQTPLKSGEAVVYSVGVGGYFSATQPAGEFLGSLEISWTVADRWLVVGTSPEMVRQIVEVRRGVGEPLAVDGAQRVLALVNEQKGAAQMALIARPDAAAAMIDSWLAYVHRHHPEMLEAEWWERLRRQQLAGNVVLGFRPLLRPTTQPGVVVDNTMPGWPAHGRLRPGDRIIAVDSQPVDAANPMDSLRSLVAARAKPGQVTLRINRGGQEQDVVVPGLAGPLDAQSIQPLTLLGDLADVLRAFSSASYVTWQPSHERANSRLELELAPGVPGTGMPKVTVIAPVTATATATAPAPTSSPATMPQ